jgi:hypothetical protein
MRKTGAHTEMAQTAGSKQQGAQHLRLGQPSTLSWAPPSRIYTRDYRVPDEDDATNKDTVSPFVGNPLQY